VRQGDDTVADVDSREAGRPLRLGIVGCGGISERHAQGAASSPDVAIVACCDVRVEVAEAWRDRHSCERAYSDYRTMIREHELDGVLIATWPTHHREQVLGCLEAGIRRVLCEKALALDRAEALEIWTAARETGALVVEGFMYRHHPAMQTMERLLASGEIGAVERIRAGFNVPDPEEVSADDPNRDWRQRPDRAGGVPWDLACYCVDACNRLAGVAPLRATAVAGTSARYGTIDRLYGLVEYESGAVGIVESSRRSDSDHELEVSGARGRIRLPVAWRIDVSEEVLLSRATGWGEFDVTRFPVEAVDPYRLQFAGFAAVARGEANPLPTLAESVVDAITMETLLRSAGERVALPVEIPAQVRAELEQPSTS
jgi:D-xylose 1-dehydrogenase (NADP+, D-xylono-1,5-lactone-forming)